MLTAICLAAVGTVRGWAKRRQNKSLLWFLIPPVAVLLYEAWFLLKLFTLGIMREWREFFVFAWILLTLYLWVRGNDYRERAKSTEYALNRQPSQCPRCGAQL